MDFIVNHSLKKLALVGSTGKMGQKVIELLSENSWKTKFNLSSSIHLETKDVLEKPDVVIDFSVPDSTLKWSQKWSELKTPVLICTTGFKKEEFETLKEKLKNNPWAMIPNTSLGIYAFIKSLRAYIKFFSDIQSITLHEVHHVHKKDSPSGTALLLKMAMLDAGFPGDIHIQSAREGEVVGTHTVIIQRSFDRLILTHEAHDRRLFAEGALLLAEKLALKAPRAQPYTFDEILS